MAKARRKIKNAKTEDTNEDYIMPRNTVTLNVNVNDAEEFDHNYEECQMHYRYWLLCNAAFRIRFGNRLMYTTPLEKTFYYVIRNGSEYVTLVIDARQGWLVGFMTARGVFQMKLEHQTSPYMDTVLCQMLRFLGNHGEISPSGTGNTRINLHALRNKVTLLCGYTGPTRQADPPGFRTAIGLKVVVFLEAKFREIYQRVRKLMRQPTEQKLGEDWVRDLIVNWSAISCQIMNFLDDLSYLPHNCCIDELKTLNDLLDSLFYLHVDAYSCGIFEHEPLPPHPRNLTWYPIDPGEGDGETIKFEEPRSPGTILCKKRVQSTSPQGDSSSKRRRGLQGGGLGGAPHVPACFRSWEQKDDKKQCDDLIEHLCEKLKVKVKNSLRDPEEAPKKLEKKEKDQEELERLKQQAAQQPKDTQKTADWHEDQNHQCTQKSESSSINGSLADDLKHLRDNGFLSDEIITFIFKSFNSYLNSKDVLFVPPSISFFMLKEQSSETIADMVSQLQLASKSLVVFAINDNNDPSLSDGGQHWSLLVLDQRAKENRQFDHYDSAGSMNHASAAKLANVLNRGYPGGAVVSEARTPQQNNGYDCGLYVIGIAKEICRWWIHGATVPFSDYVDRVTSATIATLKGDLIGKLEAFLTKDR